MRMIGALRQRRYLAVLAFALGAKTCAFRPRLPTGLAFPRVCIWDPMTISRFSAHAQGPFVIISAGLVPIRRVAASPLSPGRYKFLSRLTPTNSEPSLAAGRYSIAPPRTMEAVSTSAGSQDEPSPTDRLLTEAPGDAWRAHQPIQWVRVLCRAMKDTVIPGI